jgi:hypothetical protein
MQVSAPRVPQYKLLIYTGLFVYPLTSFFLHGQRKAKSGSEVAKISVLATEKGQHFPAILAVI